MSVDVYINFNGNCSEAVEFYAEVFGTETPRMMRFGDVPGDGGFPVDEATKNLIMHAEIKVKGNTIMFSDVPPGMPLTVGNNISLILRSDDIDEVKSVFEKLRAGGDVRMELQETFWSKCYGFVTDKFGIGWQLSLEQ